jgi:N-formylglutamate amidohydrolase
MSQEKFKHPTSENFGEKFREVVCPLELMRALGQHPLEPLQDREVDISPETFIGTDVRALEYPECPNVLITMPHAGEHAPKDLYYRLSSEGQQEDAAKIDAGTMYIGRSESIVSMWPKMSRLCGVDLNRRPFDREEHDDSPRAFMWRNTRTGFPMYVEGREPTNEEKLYFSKEYHDRYYQELVDRVGTLIEKNTNSHARILVIDLHSFPEADPHNTTMSLAWKSFLSNDALEDFYLHAPMFILSDGNGLSSDTDIKDALVHALRTNFDTCLTDEERVQLFTHIPSQKLIDTDKYLTGAYNVEFAAKQRAGALPQLNTIQIEMNESAYVDFHGNLTDAEYNWKKMEMMRNVLNKSILDIDSLLKDSRTDC